MSSSETSTTPAPAECLPLELIAEIFKIAQPRRRSRYRIPYEVSISHVSRCWRDAALNTPSLWTTIDIYSLNSLDCIQCYLIRSRTLGVDVRFDLWQWDRPSRIGCLPEISPLLDVLLPHIDRWRSLMILTYQRRTAKAILSHLRQAAAPALTRLRVSVDGLDDFDPSESVEDGLASFFVGGVPELLSVEIDGIWNLPPLFNVTTLELHTSVDALLLNFDHISAIAAAATQLTHLSIRGVVDITNWPTHAHPVLEMPAIRSLLFSNESPLPGLFLASVSVPQLYSLWIDCPDPELQQSFFNAPRFAQNRFPALRYLTLQSYGFFDTSLFARVFPSVTHLHLAYCNIFHIRYLKEALLCEGRPWWPLLTEVAIRTYRDQHIDKLARTFEEITATRSESGIPLHKLLLDHNVFNTFSKSNTLHKHTKLAELNATNYQDPWWAMAHKDTMVRI